jgi:hypothetical protein
VYWVNLNMRMLDSEPSQHGQRETESKAVTILSSVTPHVLHASVTSPPPKVMRPREGVPVSQAVQASNAG